MEYLPVVVQDPEYKIVRVSRLKRNMYPVKCVRCMVTAVLFVLYETANRAPDGDTFVIHGADGPIFSGDRTV